MDYNSFFTKDYKSRAEPHPGRRLPLSRVQLVLVLCLVGVVGTLLSFYVETSASIPTESPSATTGTAEQVLRQQLTLTPEPAAASTLGATPSGPKAAENWQTITVKSGDSLSGIFTRVGANQTDLGTIMSLGKETRTLRDLLPNQRFRFNLGQDKQLVTLVYDIDKTHSLRINRDHGGFSVNPITHDVDRRVAFAGASIKSSLFEAGSEAGMSDGLIMELVAIFGWDIDFALDIREGDQFSVMYEQHYLDGEHINDGPIIAAEFVTQGKTYKAVRYSDAAGRSEYYSPDGRSMRKEFLRTPVDFRRISSRFGSRKHPILNRIRMHKGVDYSAPVGTPIKASGDGRIVYRGIKGGYGRTIIIKHGGTYTTLYGHMSRYARGISNGKSVRQGQVIGYVGQSGLATGPHLHYEFRVAGVHRNPLTIKLPNAQPISTQYIQDFQYHAGKLLAQLDMNREVHMAMSH